MLVSFPSLLLQGYYDTMDTGFVDEEGFLYIMSRSDDVINVAGHRLSAGALEEVRAPDLRLPDLCIPHRLPACSFKRVQTFVFIVETSLVYMYMCVCTL